MSTMTVYQVEPNKWVNETLISAITGLTDRQLKDYRNFAWQEGVHFKKLSPTGAKGRNCRAMYNRVEIDCYFDNNKRVA
ncbi:excisionase family protein [Photobacterium leiognathi subsp. mandapamensis]